MAMFNGPAIKNEIIEELMKSVSKPEDLLGSDGILKQLTARLVEKALQAEMRTTTSGANPGIGRRAELRTPGTGTPARHC